MRKDQLIKKVARQLKISQAKADQAVKIILGAGAITKKQEIKIVTVEKQIPVEVIKEVTVVKKVEIIKEVVKKEPIKKRTSPKKIPTKTETKKISNTVKSTAKPPTKSTIKAKTTARKKAPPKTKSQVRKPTTRSKAPTKPRKVDPRFTKFKINNFQIIEGIGPKIEELLYRAKIKNWNELAGTPTTQLKKILEAAGSRFKVHDPSSWGKQARMAESGQWKELIKYQKILDAGKDEKRNRRSPSKVERMARIIKS